VLTVAKVKGNSADAYRQYLEGRTAPDERGDYYLKDGNVVEAPGRWELGPLGAAALGLEWPAACLTSEAFKAVMGGRHPATGEPLRRAGADATRVVALDLTFSAPKSVSVVWAFGDPELRAAVEGALERSADRAMTAAVALAPMVRRRVEGKVRHELARELITSSWRHTTARGVDGRAPDPQLHVHRLVHGAIRRDGHVAAVDSRTLLQHQRELGARFRSQLAREFEQLGFAIKRGSGRGGRYFEIEGVEPEVTETFSARHVQIQRRIEDALARRVRALEKAIAQGGEDGARAQRELDSLEFHGRLSPAQERAEAVGSRSAKGLVARGDLDRAWWQTGQRVGFDARTLQTLRGLERDPPGREQLREQVIARLTEFDATFTPTQGRAAALESAAGLGTSAELGDELYEKLHAAGVVIDLVDGRQTTSYHRALERQTVAAAEQLAGAADARRPVDAERVEREIARIDQELAAVGAGIAPEQAHAVRAACAAGRLTVIEGQAGTGKSTALQAIARAHQAAGQRILVTSTGGLAAARLARELERAGVTVEALTTEALRWRHAEGLARLDARTTVIHDEAALAATREQHFLLPACRDGGARLIAVGDGEQGQPVGAGGLWQRLGTIAQRAGARVELTAIVRARDPADRRDQVMFRHGHHRQALQGWLDRGRVTLTYRQEQAEDRALAAWHVDRAVGRDSAVFYTGSNERVDELNVRAQALRAHAGELGRDELALAKRPYGIRVGDEVLFRRRTWHEQLRRVENGTPARVLAVERDHAVLELDDGRRGAWTNRQLDDADVRLGYVQHPWPGQGLTVERLHYVHDTLANARATYVAATRPRGEFHLYAARETLEQIRDDRDQRELDVLAESLGQAEQDAPSIDVPLAQDRDGRELEPREGELHRDATELAPAAVDEGAGVAREDLHVADPLDPIREALGSDRAARLPDVPAPARLRTVEAERLRELVNERQAAIERFPGPEAFELRRLERDREQTRGERAHAARDIAALRAQRDGLGWRRRGERGQLDERIATRERAVENAVRELEALDEREALLVACGRHPDQWLERDGRHAAEWALARRELDVRRELAVREAGERAIVEPPAHVRRLLGDPPERAGEPRDRWEQLARDLERYRLEHGVDVDRDASIGRRPSGRAEQREHLVERIRELRAERGLAPEAPGLELDVDAPELDLGP
jgi:conjugative relaxase-like TrwC/TraI family protein